MFNVFLLNLLPQSCGQWFLLWQIFFILQKKNISLQIPFYKEKNAKKGINIFVKICQTCLQYERVLKIFFFHILNIANFG
jgi:hypothetical protein